METLQTDYPLKVYMRSNRWIDHENDDVLGLIETRQWQGLGQWAAAQKAFEFVRDEVQHSTDHSHRRVVRTTVDALRCREGLCHVKAMLLAALLRALGIPSGLAYQRLSTKDGAHALRGLTTIYMPNLGVWGRVDVCGDDPRVETRFSVGAMISDRMICQIRPELGEVDYPSNLPEPAPAITRALEAHDDWRRCCCGCHGCCDENRGGLPSGTRIGIEHVRSAGERCDRYLSCAHAPNCDCPRRGRARRFPLASVPPR